MTAPARFREIDVARAIKGAKRAGMIVGGVRIAPNGEIVILSEAVAPAGRRNDWDEDLRQ